MAKPRTSTAWVQAPVKLSAVASFHQSPQLRWKKAGVYEKYKKSTAEWNELRRLMLDSKGQITRAIYENSFTYVLQ